MESLLKLSPAWLCFNLRPDGNLRVLSFGNNGLVGVDDTVIVFDVSKGGSVVSMTIPEPNGIKSEVKLNYVEHEGIWLPRRISRIKYSERARLLELNIHF